MSNKQSSYQKLKMERDFMEETIRILVLEEGSVAAILAASAWKSKFEREDNMLIRPRYEFNHMIFLN